MKVIVDLCIREKSKKMERFNLSEKSESL